MLRHLGPHTSLVSHLRVDWSLALLSHRDFGAMKKKTYRVKLNIMKRNPSPREEPSPMEMDVRAISEEDASATVRANFNQPDSFASIRSIVEIGVQV